jgi:hypothetical protein
MDGKAGLMLALPTARAMVPPAARCLPGRIAAPIEGCA